MNYITENLDTLLQILGAVYFVASLVATLTPTTEDDTFLAKIGRLADRIGLQLKTPKK